MAMAIIAIASSLWLPWTLLRAKPSSAHSHSPGPSPGPSLGFGLGLGLDLGYRMARFSKVKNIEAALKVGIALKDGHGSSKKVALN